jgi:hypothetical protein
MDPDDLQRVYTAHLERVRRWGILAVLAGYGPQPSSPDIDEALRAVSPRVQAAYGAAMVNALDTTDEWMALAAALHGLDYLADWRKGRPLAPLQLFGGRPLAQWQALAAGGIKALIGQGMPAEQAWQTSRARAAQQVASGPLQAARSTTWNRFLTDAVIGAGDTVPGSPWVAEVEQYANLWDGQRAREYPGTWQRWQRVPSPGACGFCLMLATRSDYTSADAAMYAGGAEGTERRVFRRGRDMRGGVFRRTTSGMPSGERYHKSCRCTVRMVPKGSPAAISQEDYDRLTTRDADGNLPVFYHRDVVYKSGRTGRYNYTAADFDFEVAAGVPMPPTAPWKDAWQAPPKYAAGKQAYKAWAYATP